MLSILSLLLLSSLPASAQTSYSKLLARIQSTYLGREAASYPILIMDRDELEWRFVKEKAIRREDEQKRAAIVQAYVQEKTGVRIHENAAANFEPYLSQLKDAAVAMPAFRDGSSGAVEMCAVFPPDPNRNRRLETERILQLQTKEAYGSHHYDQLQATLSYDDALLISVLHEAGHCMDRFFFPQMFETGDDPATLHLVESFAETMAIFLMAKEGRVNVAPTRAYLRDIYSYFMEPYFVAHPELGFGSSSFAYGGIVYHLSPSIFGAEAQLKARLPEIQAMPLAKLQDLAAEVVREKSFNSRMLAAVYVAYSDGREVALARYEEFEKTMPDLFQGILERLKTYLERADRFQASAFDPSPKPPASPIKELQPLSYQKACALLAKENYAALLSEVDALRTDLQQGNPSPEAERVRFRVLSELWSTLPLQCQGEKVEIQPHEDIASSLRSTLGFGGCALPLSYKRVAQ